MIVDRRWNTERHTRKHATRGPLFCCDQCRQRRRLASPSGGYWHGDLYGGSEYPVCSCCVAEWKGEREYANE